jgi:hypothetical protein
MTATLERRSGPDVWRPPVEPSPAEQAVIKVGPIQPGDPGQRLARLGRETFLLDAGILIPAGSSGPVGNVIWAYLRARCRTSMVHRYHSWRLF